MAKRAGSGREHRSWFRPAIERLESRIVLSVSFVDSGQSLGYRNSAAVALGDLDGDGDLDAFFAVIGGNRVFMNETQEVPGFLAGDANRDFRFDQQDIVQVLLAAKYLTGQQATFDECDWNGDGVFDQLDILVALQTGNYLQGPYALRAGAIYVPGKWIPH